MSCIRLATYTGIDCLPDVKEHRWGTAIAAIENAYRSISSRINNHTKETLSTVRLYSEDIFHSILVLERKRTERSNTPFMLIRIDISLLPVQDDAFAATARIIRRINDVTRETDVKGWFVDRRVIGIIVTECEAVYADSIFNKIDQLVREEAGALPLQSGLVSCNIFPCKAIGDDADTVAFTAALYHNGNVDSVSHFLSELCKRWIDIIGSLMGIVLFSPFFLIVPLLIKLSSKGPVFFTQKRVGQFGKIFPCFKFRTMKPSSDESLHKEYVRRFINGANDLTKKGQPAIYKIQNDPRITKLGNLLRKTSIDEMPQFFNVLIGHMSLVGPRPAIPYEVEEYDTWHRRRSLELKPGITGIWQVKGRSRTDFDNMVRMDIQYIKKWSPILDLRLLATTPAALINGKGAY